MRPDDWIKILASLHEKREPCVLLTVLEEKGSVPRDSGSKMIVTAGQSFLTIGGGHLEYQCIALAREMLTTRSSEPRSEHFNLGARLGQCCGGMTSVPPADPAPSASGSPTPTNWVLPSQPPSGS